jgi:hypothetical protein
MLTLATQASSEPSLQFTVNIRHDPILGARVVLRLQPTVFVEPVHTLPELSAYFGRMAQWAEWQPTARFTEAQAEFTRMLEATFD